MLLQDIHTRTITRSLRCQFVQRAEQLCLPGFCSAHHDRYGIVLCVLPLFFRDVPQCTDREFFDEVRRWVIGCWLDCCNCLYPQAIHLVLNQDMLVLQQGCVDLSSIHRMIWDDGGDCLVVTIHTGIWLGCTSGNSQASKCASDTAHEDATPHVADVMAFLHFAAYGHGRIFSTDKSSA